MSTSKIETAGAQAVRVSATEDTLITELADGRTIQLPLAWFPRLKHATRAERARWRLIGGGVGIHWPDLDEDISTESLLAHRKSGESPESLRRWLDARNRA